MHTVLLYSKVALLNEFTGNLIFFLKRAIYVLRISLIDFVKANQPAVLCKFMG